MTVYRSVDEARIDPHVLSKQHQQQPTPTKLEQLLRDARTIRRSKQPYAFQAGYFWATLEQIEKYIKENKIR